tara:strand:+ start:276 stop:458 length:183 start_codon:yes stop_codon:yes gene_type:complete
MTGDIQEEFVGKIRKISKSESESVDLCKKFDISPKTINDWSNENCLPPKKLQKILIELIP